MLISEVVGAGPTPLSAVMLKVKLPTFVGVPESTPVVGLNSSPGGRLPLTEYVAEGQPEVVNV